MPRPALVVDGTTNADAAYMNNEIISSIGDLLQLDPKLGDGTTESIVDVLNRLAYVIGPVFKNRVINGDFQIWQRGTSVTNSLGGYKTADRWEQTGNQGSFDVTKSTMNGWNSMKVSVNTVPDLSRNYAIYIPFRYKFEGQHLYDIYLKGSNITISFLFRSNITGSFCVAVCNFTDTSVQIESYVHEFQYATAGAIQKVTFTVHFARAFNPALRNDANLGIVLLIAPLGGSDYQTTTKDAWLTGYYLTTPNAVNWASSVGNYVEIAQVQVEEGDTATDFEFVPFDIQLLRCMRYYFRTDKNPNYTDHIGHFYALKSGSYYRRFIYPFPVEMRVRPTISFVSTTVAESGGTYNPAIYQASSVFAYFRADQSGDYWVAIPHFQADAEL